MLIVNHAISGGATIAAMATAYYDQASHHADSKWPVVLVSERQPPATTGHSDMSTKKVAIQELIICHLKNEAVI